MEKYRLLALDMDGTVLDSKKRFPNETVQAIHALAQNNIYCALATGRCLAELAGYQEALREIRFAILTSGSVVYDFQRKTPIYVQSIPLADIKRIIAAGQTEQAMIHLMTIENSVAREYDIERMKEYQLGVYQEMYEKVCLRQDDISAYAEAHAMEVVKINLYHRSADSREQSRKRLQDLDLKLAYAEKTSLEASPSGTTKASGLVILCNHLGISMEQTVAIGDAPNDANILKAAGLSIAMGNASADIKKLCDMVTEDNDHNGVVKAIEKVFKIN